LKKFTGGFKHKVRMLIYAIFLFALVTAGIILSKPTETENFKIFTYSSVALVFLINLIAGIYLIDSSIRIMPNINNRIVDGITNIINRQGISPTQSFQAPSTVSDLTQQ
jgi:hypothetical protein